MRDKYVNSHSDLEYYFEQYPNLLFVVGEDGFLRKINPAVISLLGYTEDELFSAPIDELIHPEDREITQHLRLGQVRAGDFAEYENRLLTKNATIVWLSWSSVFIERDQVFFAIARNITDKKKEEEQAHVVAILNRLGDEQRIRFTKEIAFINPVRSGESSKFMWLGITETLPNLDQKWMEKFEFLIRENAAKSNLSLKFLSAEMAMSERQVYRYINRIVLMTPKKLITMVRMHMVWEVILSGNEHDPAVLGKMVGFVSTSRFKKLFHKTYGIEITALL
ncbi:PAS domain S-box protein [Pedobacter agri]|uniref:PAS domain S-box protein n=1 Tax=Pedobacter agri TaxID=454586 RepID=UPI00292F7336|nr:PAS domain S-box protein [Pedobacter agri]